jgi:surface antigen
MAPSSALRQVVLAALACLVLSLGMPLALLVAPAPAGATVLGNDYPAALANAPKDSGVDPWGFYNRECTSFVAWRLNSANGVGFKDLSNGVQWGNAENWGPTAQRLGIPVNGVPAVGAVAWDAGGVDGASSEGHVSWVANIESNGTVDVEEYNYTHAGGYDLRTGVNPATFSGFIHVADLAQHAPATQAVTADAGTHGYWLVGSDGGIFSFGRAPFLGSTGSIPLQGPVVGITPTSDGAGYWLVASDGGVFAFGDADYHGSIPGLGLGPPGASSGKHLNAPIVGMVPSADGGGYFMVASDGGVFAFGDATYQGSCPAIGGCRTVQAVIPDATGDGYWVINQTGGVYVFGDATYYGGVATHGVPVVGAARAPDGGGYWIVLADGAVYSFGDANFFGTAAGFLTATNPATAIFPTADGAGYWITSANGTVDAFGDAPNVGGMAGARLNGSIIAGSGF